MPRRSDRRGGRVTPKGGDMPPGWAERWTGRFMRGVFAAEEPEPLDRATAERMVARLWRSKTPEARRSAWKFEEKLSSTTPNRKSTR